ncbi:unnamed protein product [Boreogadus saida]
MCRLGAAGRGGRTFCSRRPRSAEVLLLFPVPQACAAVQRQTTPLRAVVVVVTGKGCGAGRHCGVSGFRPCARSDWDGTLVSWGGKYIDATDAKGTGLESRRR